MKTLIAAVMLCLSTVASAEVVSYITAADLIRMLKSPKVVDKANAAGYTIGVFDSTFGSLHCTPKIHPNNLLDAVVKSSDQLPAEKLAEIGAADFVIAVIVVNGKKCNLI